MFSLFVLFSFLLFGTLANTTIGQTPFLSFKNKRGITTLHHGHTQAQDIARPTKKESNSHHQHQQTLGTTKLHIHQGDTIAFFYYPRPYLHPSTTFAQPPPTSQQPKPQHSCLSHSILPSSLSYSTNKGIYQQLKHTHIHTSCSTSQRWKIQSRSSLQDSGRRRLRLLQTRSTANMPTRYARRRRSVTMPGRE